MSTTIGRLHKRTLLGTASLGTLGVVGGSPVLIAAGGVSLLTLLFAGLGLHDGVRSAARRWAVHGVTVILLLFTVALIGRLKIDAVFMILMLGVGNRALLRASSRDDVLIVGGAAVLLAAATVVTSGLAFAALLFAAVPCAAAALWTSTMIAAAEHAPAETARMRSRVAPKGALGLGLAALALTLAGFGVSTLLPRYRFTPFLGAGAFSGMPGASDSMRLTNDGIDDRDSGEVVLRVFPGAGIDRAAVDGLYARVFALDEFDGRAWSSRTGGHFPAAREMEGEMTGKPSARVSMSRMTRAGVHHPVAVFGRSGPWAVSGRGLHFDLSGTMVIDGMPARSFEYATALGVPLPPPARKSGLAATGAEGGLELPLLDPRVRALGEQLAEGNETPDAKIQAVLRHFARGFTYSTAALEGTAADPLARFLFESKTGHCELYAGAVATLLRVAGLEARVASGYYLGRWNDLGEYLAFSQGDAHAWVEVWTERGWRWVDATPEDLRGRRDESVFRKLRDWYDVASGLWFDNVVDYDAKRQQAFYMRMSKALDAQLRALGKDPSGSARQLGGSLFDGARESSAILLVPLLVAALIAGVITWRSRRSPEGLGRRLRRALGEKSGENVPLGTLRARAGQGDDAVRLYERLRFAPPDQRPRPKAVADAIAALEKALRR